MLSVPHLAGYWRLEEAEGAAARDSGPNGLDGAIGGPSLGVPGAIASQPESASMSWDTSGDSIAVAHAEVLNANHIGGGHVGFSVEAWVRPEVWEEWDTIAMKAGNGFDTGWGLGHLTAAIGGADTVRFWIDRWDGCGGVQTDVPVGAWTHIVATWDGDAGLSLYKNGELAATGSYTCGWPRFNSSPLSIGHGSGDLCAGEEQCSFSGLVDEVAVYDGELSADEVAAHFAAASPACAGGH